MVDDRGAEKARLSRDSGTEYAARRSRLASVWQLLILSVTVGLIFGWPHLLIPALQRGHGLEGQYTPLYFDGANAVVIDELTRYAAKTRDVYDGHLWVDEAFAHEHRGAPSPYETLPHFLLGLATHLTGSVALTYALADFLLPPVLFVLIVVLVRRLTGSKAVGIMAGAGVLFGYQVLDYLPPTSRSDLVGMVYTLFYYRNGTRQLEFSRLIHPEMTFIFMLGAIIALYGALDTKRRAQFALSGVLGASLFYSFPHYAVYFGTVLALLVLRYLWLGDRLMTTWLLLVGGLTVLLALPYLVGLLHFLRLPDSGTILNRTIIKSAPAVPMAQAKYLALIVLGFVLVREKDEAFWFVNLVLVAGVICLSVQGLAGRDIGAGYWLERMIKPWAVLALSFLAARVGGEWYRTRFLPRVAVILTVILLMSGLVTQSRYALFTYPVARLPHDFSQAFAWLNRHSKVDDVVLTASLEMNCLLPAYTHNDLFIANAFHTLTPTAEILDRFLVGFRILGVDPGEVETILQDSSYHERFVSRPPETDWITYLTHAEYLERATGRFDLPESFVGRALASYRSLDTSLPRLLQRYRLDYILVSDREARPVDRELSRHTDAFTEVYRNDRIAIFQVQHRT